LFFPFAEWPVGYTFFAMSQSAFDDITTAPTLFAALRDTAQRHPQKVAYKAYGGQGRSYTYAEVYERVRALAAGLQTVPYAAVRAVALLAENCPEWAIAYLGVVAAGKTVVPIDAGLKPGEIESLLNLSQVKLAIVSGKFEHLIRQQTGIDCLSFDPTSPNDWEQAIGMPDEHVDSATRDTTAALLYTSGATGLPKAVQLTHGNLLANLESVRKALAFGHDDIWYSVLPLHHTFEATCGFLTPMACGATVVYARSLKSKEIIEDIRANHVTVMCGVPLLYEKMYQAIRRGLREAPVHKRLSFRFLYELSRLGWMGGGDLGKRLLAGFRERIGMSDMRMFVSGGAPLPPHIAEFFNLVGINFLQGYGMTECSPVISVNRPRNVRFGSVGPPLEGVEIRIADPDAGGVGEILVRGSNITPGYKDNPRLTEELLAEGGWLRTGDLGRYDDGHLWITGRAKNLIVSAAGKNIYPEELEEKLLASPYVLEALVVGRRKESRLGEEAFALIVPDVEQFAAEFGLSVESPDLDFIRKQLTEVVAEVNSRIADYKRIAAFEVSTSELEKTSTKKIKRFLYSQS
jgi:long-chain acyl-CoA synthetase